MINTSNRQPAKAGDTFDAGGGTRVVVLRASRNPDKPWVDIDVTDRHGFSWSKRMPTGVPASWQRVEVSA